MTLEQRYTFEVEKRLHEAEATIAQLQLKVSGLEVVHAEDLKTITRLESLINTPETEDFDKAVPLEAAHQVLRWGVAQDSGKTPADWFWLLGYLAGKALRSALSGDTEKAKHHCISSAAALRNWHAHLRSGETLMRPGIDTPSA